MSSKRIEHIHDVCKHIKDTILAELDAGNEVITESGEDIKPYACKAFKEVAKRKKIKESTVRAACTRAMGLNSKTFYDMIEQRLNYKNQNKDNLIGRMESRKTEMDSHSEIERIMDEIF